MKDYKMKAKIVPGIIAGITLMAITHLQAGELRIGAAQADITPKRPVALTGGRTAPISKGVNSPVTANALALEWSEEGRQTCTSRDHCIV